MTEIEATLPTTIPLRKFAKIAFGVSENTAYSRQEDIPTMRLGNLLLVAPRVALARELDETSTQALAQALVFLVEQAIVRVESSLNLRPHAWSELT